MRKAEDANRLPRVESRDEYRRVPSLVLLAIVLSLIRSSMLGPQGALIAESFRARLRVAGRLSAISSRRSSRGAQRR